MKLAYFCIMKRVVVGLSGGVDSSVAAYLLKEQGYEVIGIFMKNWHDESVTLSDECPWIDDSNDALIIAQQLNIPFQVIDFSKEYKERIVDYMFAEYEQGRTPNPDILCNREIKFDAFLNAALELGADFVATGHYCRRIVHENGSFGLLAGIDPNKDQSYFLCQLNQFQLSKALFPIGELLKSEVRQIAMTNNLATAEKKDSQGLCFVGKISLPEFLQQQLKPKKGDVIEIESTFKGYEAIQALPVTSEHVENLAKPIEYHSTDGVKVTEHQGAHYYTIGQRKGLHVGGRPHPSFVIHTDTETNTVYTGQLDNHPGLNKWALKINTSDFHFVQPSWNLDEMNDRTFDVRIRYRQPLQRGRIIVKSDGIYILFEKIQRGITPGQFAAIYEQNELIASGVILY